MNEKAKNLVIQYYVKRDSIINEILTYGPIDTKKMVDNINKRIAQINALDDNFDSLKTKNEELLNLYLEKDIVSAMNKFINGNWDNSAFEEIGKNAEILNCSKVNNFKPAVKGLPIFNNRQAIEELNYDNRDIEILLETGFNASIANQYNEVASLLDGKQTKATNGELIILMSEKLGVQGSHFKMTYSEFIAKYDAIMALNEIKDYEKVPFSKSNNLYLYNTVVNLMASIKDKKVNSDDIDFYDDMEILDTIDNDIIQKLLDKSSTPHIQEVNEMLNEKFDKLDELRKQLENDIFDKSNDKFNAKKCINNFYKEVEMLNKDAEICVEE